ncbi:MAG: phosphoribosylaminoimidazolesuccinocarboxamide synthase [Armatimonas sp.]
MSEAILETHIAGLPDPRRGKVRDVYVLDDNRVLLVATDRLSAFDVVMEQGIPDKGKILTQISSYWFAHTQEIIPNHLISADDAVIAEAICEVGGTWTEALAGRTMLCKKTTPLLIEAVVRGYISGSMWKDYRAEAARGGAEVTLWGQALPTGLTESDRLPEPLFTPSTKAEKGQHDAQMTPDEAKALLGDYYGPLVQAALALYKFATERCEKVGLMLADTKFEFGVDDAGQLLLIDEALTPDSSRYWPAESYTPGGAQPSFDKQFVRDFLETVPGWNKQPPPPELPANILAKTADKYREALIKITQ